MKPTDDISSAYDVVLVPKGHPHPANAVQPHAAPAPPPRVVNPVQVEALREALALAERGELDSLTMSWKDRDGLRWRAHWSNIGSVLENVGQLERLKVVLLRTLGDG